MPTLSVSYKSSEVEEREKDDRIGEDNSEDEGEEGDDKVTEKEEGDGKGGR